VLQEGGTVTEDDLVLEVSRLFGYQRRGSRIEERIQDALALLEEVGLVDRGGRLSIDESIDPEQAILSQVYPSVPEPEPDDDGGENPDAGQSALADAVTPGAEEEPEPEPEPEPPSDSTTASSRSGGTPGADATPDRQRNGETPETDLLETPRGRRLLGLFEAYADREESRNDWLDLTFENEGETAVHYQYADAHNLVGLTDEQRASIGSVVADHDGLTIADEGDVYVLLENETTEPEPECRLCLELLDRVYDTSLSELEAAAAHGEESVLPDDEAGG
jgi:hypothetical protein